MSITPTGDLSLRIQNLRLLVAASSTFQGIVGAENAAAALASVYPGESPDFRDSAIPAFAVVDYESGYDVPILAEGHTGVFVPGSRFLLVLVIPITESTVSDAYFDFANDVGAIVADMIAQSAVPGYLVVNTIGLSTQLLRTDPEEGESDAHYFVKLSVTTGL